MTKPVFHIDDAGVHAICNSEAEAIRIAQELGAEHYGGVTVFADDPAIPAAAGYTVLDGDDEDDD